MCGKIYRTLSLSFLLCLKYRDLWHQAHPHCSTVIITTLQNFFIFPTETLQLLNTNSPFPLPPSPWKPPLHSLYFIIPLLMDIQVALKSQEYSMTSYGSPWKLARVSLTQRTRMGFWSHRGYAVFQNDYTAYNFLKNTPEFPCCYILSSLDLPTF